jgi:hypothetical protein
MIAPCSVALLNVNFSSQELAGTVVRERVCTETGGYLGWWIGINGSLLNGYSMKHYTVHR